MRAEATPGGDDGGLTVDRLPDPTDPVSVHRIERLRLAPDVREPHRHDYHALLRALKRHHGEAPQAYRARVQGKSMDR